MIILAKLFTDIIHYNQFFFHKTLVREVIDIFKMRRRVLSVAVSYVLLKLFGITFAQNKKFSQLFSITWKHTIHAYLEFLFSSKK